MLSSFYDVSENVTDNNSDKGVDVIKEFNDMNDTNEFKGKKENEATPTKRKKETP